MKATSSTNSMPLLSLFLYGNKLHFWDYFLKPFDFSCLTPCMLHDLWACLLLTGLLQQLTCEFPTCFVASFVKNQGEIAQFWQQGTVHCTANIINRKDMLFARHPSHKSIPCIFALRMARDFRSTPWNSYSKDQLQGFFSTKGPNGKAF